MNCSPKSNDGELAVIDPHRIAHLDRTGSGVETIAHLRENGRIVLMFCAFQGPPRIVRIHGHGSVVGRDDEAVARREDLHPARWRHAHAGLTALNGLGPGPAKVPASRAQWTILAIGSSMMSVAPRSFSSGISTLISDFGTTASTA